MNLISTKGESPIVSFKRAVARGLAPDGGLYLPDRLEEQPLTYWKSMHGRSIPSIAEKLFDTLIGDEFDRKFLKELTKEAFDFPVPVVPIDERTGVLELFHGPTLAFKDFGARFMARVMPVCTSEADAGGTTSRKPLTILTATSGDTGAAVAQGFHGVEGVRAFVLYPKGKVSPLQERQFSTLGGNITSVAVDGTFDDCQALVKAAFAREELTSGHRLTSANSINIARLLPQMVYYVAAWAELTREAPHRKITFVVPSGNFGNLTAGVMAGRMGLPGVQFIAATNANDVVPQFLEGGAYSPRGSVATISNAMDVGNPSNFDRLLHLFGGNEAALRGFLKGDRVSDDRTREVIADIWNKHEYLCDPHTATGLETWLRLQSADRFAESYGVVLGTAHPAKFIETMEEVVPGAVVIPERLEQLRDREVLSVEIGPDLDALVALL